MRFNKPINTTTYIVGILIILAIIIGILLATSCATKPMQPPLPPLPPSGFAGGQGNALALPEESVTVVAPSVLPVSGVGTWVVQLGWHASISTNVIGYKVYYGPASRNYTNSIDVARSYSLVISGLTYGATYYFAVTAYATNNLESDYSNEIQYTVPSSVPVPIYDVLSAISINNLNGVWLTNLVPLMSITNPIAGPDHLYFKTWIQKR